MGVSGEDHGWSAEGLAPGVVLRGSAKSSGRDGSYAQIVVEGLEPGACEPIFAGFAAAFPTIMSEAELAAELG